MQELLTVTCPNCNASFKTTLDNRGQGAECPHCKSSFIIPSDLDKKQTMDETSSLQDAKNADAINPMIESGTVKIDRNSIGMIPPVQDKFKVEFSTIKTNPEIRREDLELDKKPAKKKWWKFW